MSKLAARSLAALAALVLALVGLWLATRESAAPERRDRPDASSAVANDAVDSELAGTPNLSRAAATDAETSHSVEPSAAESPRCRIVLVRDGVDEPYSGTGFVTVTRRAADEAPTAHEVPVTAGAFTVAPPPDGESLTIERVLVDLGRGLGAVDILEAPALAPSPSADVVVRVAPHLTVRLALVDSVDRRPIDTVILFGDEDEYFATGRPLGIGAVEVRVPAGVGEFMAEALFHARTRVATPGMQVRDVREVALVAQCSVEVELDGVALDRAHRLVLASSAPSNVEVPDFIDLEPGVTSTTIRVPQAGLHIALVDHREDEPIAIAFAACNGDHERVRLIATPDRRGGSIVVTGSIDECPDPAKAIQLLDVDPRIHHPMGPSPRSNRLREPVAIDTTSRTFRAVFDVAVGLHAIYNDCDLIATPRRVVVSSGEEVHVALASPVIDEVLVRLIDVRRGEFFVPEHLFATRLGAEPFSVLVEVPSPPRPVMARVPRGLVKFSVRREQDGVSESCVLGPFDVAAGGPIDLYFVPEQRRHVVVPRAGSSALMESWANAWSIVDEDGGSVAAQNAFFASPWQPDGDCTIGFASTLTRAFVAPPPHPLLGPLASGWVTFDASGEAQFELVPLLGD
jgi:hypothetical protein